MTVTNGSHDGWTSKKVCMAQFLQRAIFVSKVHNRKDRFETLCHVSADISAAPFTTKLGKSRRTCYVRKFYLVLLVGLTELKAQISWTDSTTVCIHRPTWLSRLFLLGSKRRGRRIGASLFFAHGIPQTNSLRGSQERRGYCIQRCVGNCLRWPRGCFPSPL